MSVSTAGALNLPPAIWPPHAQGRAACRSVHVCDLFVGLVRTVYIYTVYIRYFGREIIKYTVIYGVYIRFWPTLPVGEKHEGQVKRCIFDTDAFK